MSETETRFGIFKGQPVNIEQSSSGCDETIVPVDGTIEARVGPSEHSDVLLLDPVGLTFKNLKDNGNGYFEVDIKDEETGENQRTVYIAKP